MKENGRESDDLGKEWRFREVFERRGSWTGKGGNWFPMFK